MVTPCWVRQSEYSFSSARWASVRANRPPPPPLGPLGPDAPLAAAAAAADVGAVDAVVVARAPVPHAVSSAASPTAPAIGSRRDRGKGKEMGIGPTRPP